MERRKLKAVGGYVLGVPRVFGGARLYEEIIDHLRYLLGRDGARADDPETMAAVDQYILNYHTRLMDKGAALVQTVALVAAIEGFFVAGEFQSVYPVLGLAALGLFMLCAFLLLQSILVFWPRHMIKDAAAAKTGQEIWRMSLVREVVRRTRRHTLAVWLLAFGILLSVADRVIATAADFRDAYPIVRQLDDLLRPERGMAGSAR